MWGKEVPYINDNMKAFFDNLNSGTNHGRVALFLEKNLAAHTVIIGKSATENSAGDIRCLWS